MNPTSHLTMRVATAADLPAMQEIREAAFAPVFASFRAILGDSLYALTQAGDDGAQARLLVSLVAPGSEWEVFAAERDARVVGFVAIKLDPHTEVGEIGLNAVHPNHSGQGIGTTMYEYALSRMKAAGMRAAAVGTGGDSSHAPARRAYEKVGFTVGIPSIWLSRAL